ncbi:hypothetical protein GGS23DRAFT_170446 [Durotheca rogersii]|uniref:uncharacterized protein n=1 Tax=Durotheca rogersii TaxID=419775 RepID=UPI00221FB877|nr:uncharacterized protein GGS23DRAFT_170446 [Durotheca rogersii]KAI5867311.1 hypothetical protein GGS23DRAFT_170446 [Durotheca rogersii]
MPARIRISGVRVGLLLRITPTSQTASTPACSPRTPPSAPYLLCWRGVSGCGYSCNAAGKCRSSTDRVDPPPPVGCYEARTFDGGQWTG